MHDAFDHVRRLLRGPPGHVHCLGIGGIGMAGLAFHLRRRGFRVSGCDRQAVPPMAAWLSAHGIEVLAGHDPAHAATADWVVHTAAIPDDHPELRAAAARGCPVFRRGVVLAALLSFGRSLIVCGSHGKTTTAAMIATLLRQAGRDPSWCIGGETALGGVAGAGAGDWFVAEADESDGSLAWYAPDLAVVTGIEFDHAEHFGGLANLRDCFAAMLKRARGPVIYGSDDPEARALCAGRPGASGFGLEPAAGWRAEGLEASAVGTVFRLRHGDADLGEVRLAVPGLHNVRNALAAAAAAADCGLGPEDLRAGLAAFRPVRRRFERVADTEALLVVSDYAHHPSEIAAALETLRKVPRRRWRVIFQPHRYSRTAALGDGFAAVLSGVPGLLLAPVYAASEPERPDGTAEALYARCRAVGGDVRCAGSLDQAWGGLRAALEPGDGLLVLGAGDVERIAAWARDELAARGIAGLDPASAWAEALARLPWKATAWRRREPLAGRTTLRVGGAADLWAEIGDPDDLAALRSWARGHGVLVTILGAGSNVLVSDLGARGIVARLVGPSFASVQRAAPNRVTAGAAVPLPVLLADLASAGLAGLEFLAGIPGTVGGALRMNAGAWGRAIGEWVREVRWMDSDGAAQNVPGAALGFGYRRADGLAGAVILEATFDLAPDEPAAIRARMAEFRARRVWQRAGEATAGSVFRNPAGGPAGRLLEDAGMKGQRIGGARVLDAHANVIATEPGATASDVAALIARMRAAVQARSGIELEPEIVFIG